MDWDSIKKGLLGLAAVVVGGFFIWFEAADGKGKILGWFESASVEIRSVSREAAADFLAHEQLRISLRKAKPEKVFWIFDDKEVKDGNVDIDYAFPFDPHADKGLRQSHWIDAFYKQDGSYHVASKRFFVQNVDYGAQVRIDGQKLEVAAQPSVSVNGTTWKLVGATLATALNGKFLSKLDLGSFLPSNRSAFSTGEHGRISASVTSDTVNSALGESQQTTLDRALSSSNAQVALKYADPRKQDQQLTLLQQAAPKTD